MASDRTFAIIGTGQAGGWTAKTLRDEGFDGRVVLIGEETYPPYERPPLSKEVLLGTAAPDSTYLWPEGTLEGQEVDVKLGAAVSREIAALYFQMGDYRKTLELLRPLCETAGDPGHALVRLERRLV